jgi:hypothetical protein
MPMLAPALLLLKAAVLLVTPSAGVYVHRVGACRILSDNHLTGPIPDSLGSLSSLQSMCVPVC